MFGTPKRSGIRVSPVVLLLALLVLVFCVELAFMFAWDTPLRQHAPVWVVALLDAALVTTVASLGGWWLFVRPLRGALSTEAAHAKAVFEATTEAIVTSDQHGTIMAFNASAERVFGYPAGEVLGKDIALLIQGDRAHKHERFISWCLAASRERRRELSREWMGVRKDGSKMPMEVSITAVRMAGEAPRYTCFVRDIGERKRLEESTRMLAYHDTLTGLPNRALFYDRLRQSIAIGKRHKHRFALLYLDLDGFKAVNDKLGHDAGDQLLKSAAQRIRGLLRESDTVARMGGDEFCVILTRSGGRPMVARVARKIIKAIAAPFTLNHDKEATVDSSIGIAIYPDNGEEIDTLVRKADAAMYQAKRTGGAFYFSGHEEPGKPVHTPR